MSGAVQLPPPLAYIMGTPAAPLEAVRNTIQRAIDALDDIDGDPDLEPNGDELDGSLGEDDFCLHNALPGPGCPISDPDSAVDDRPCDGDDDREPDEPVIPIYGIDQTAWPLNINHPRRDPVPDYPCGPVFPAGR